MQIGKTVAPEAHDQEVDPFDEAAELLEPVRHEMILEVKKEMFQKIESICERDEGPTKALKRVLNAEWPWWPWSWWPWWPWWPRQPWGSIQWQYEYDGMVVDEIDFVDYLKSRGEQGWELVLASGDFVGGRDVRMIWKKQK